MQLTKATTRSVAVLAVLTALSFLVAACGGGPAHNGGGRTGSALPPALAAQTRQRIAFVRCMRGGWREELPLSDGGGRRLGRNGRGRGHQSEVASSRAGRSEAPAAIAPTAKTAYAVTEDKAKEVG